MAASAQLKNSIELFRRKVRELKISENIDLQKIVCGQTEEFIKLYRFLLCEYNASLSKKIFDLGYEMAGSNDSIFIESLYRLMRDHFACHPPVNRSQFLSSGYAQKKIEMATEICSKLFNWIKQIEESNNHFSSSHSGGTKSGKSKNKLNRRKRTKSQDDGEEQPEIINYRSELPSSSKMAGDLVSSSNYLRSAPSSLSHGPLKSSLKRPQSSRLESSGIPLKSLYSTDSTLFGGIGTKSYSSRTTTTTTAANEMIEMETKPRISSLKVDNWTSGGGAGLSNNTTVSNGLYNNYSRPTDVMTNNSYNPYNSSSTNVENSSIPWRNATYLKSFPQTRTVPMDIIEAVPSSKLSHLTSSTQTYNGIDRNGQKFAENDLMDKLNEIVARLTILENRMNFYDDHRTNTFASSGTGGGSGGASGINQEAFPRNPLRRDLSWSFNKANSLDNHNSPYEAASINTNTNTSGFGISSMQRSTTSERYDSSFRSRAPLSSTSGRIGGFSQFNSNNGKNDSLLENVTTAAAIGKGPLSVAVVNNTTTTAAASRSQGISSADKISSFRSSSDTKQPTSTPPTTSTNSNGVFADQARRVENILQETQTLLASRS